MAARFLTEAERRAAPEGRQAALDLARRAPALIVAAKQIAASLVHGVHGRRRAGLGETFWQYRQFMSGEAAQRVDWRRSARDDRLYVREREWEAAHTVWIWMDLSPSMAFVSDLAQQSKVERALVLGLACADLLVRGGERVGLLGLTRARASRDIVEHLAEALLHARGADGDLPPAQPVGPRERCLLISDFLVAPDALAERLAALTGRGATGHLLTVADPIEESFPFSGHVEFLDSDSPQIMRAARAQDWRQAYAQRLATHRAAIAETARAHGLNVAMHRTDRPASEALLALRTRLEEAA
ncbi:MAG: DUF58 domain-containing protein [Hyphomicrobiales bacterium]|nr:DUF58 domain-containing protein [Hyphomicrobiales bacterium]